MIVHLTPSILNSWDELRHANDESPSWVTPEEFKKHIVGTYQPNISTEAGNAVHKMVFEGINRHTKYGKLVVKTDNRGRSFVESTDWNYVVNDEFFKFRKMFPYGYGVTEVSKVKYFPEQVEGFDVRISGRSDYLSENLNTELKTSSKPFSGKGAIRKYLESQQSFSYTWFWGIPTRFLFAEIEFDKKDNPMVISLKKASSSTAYPCVESIDRLYDCVRSLVPYLQEDADMWYVVTNRPERDEL